MFPISQNLVLARGFEVGKSRLLGTFLLRGLSNVYEYEDKNKYKFTGYDAQE